MSKRGVGVCLKCLVANDHQPWGRNRCALHDPGRTILKQRCELIEENLKRARRAAAKAEAAQAAARKLKLDERKKVRLNDFLTQDGSVASGAVQ